VIGLYQVRCSIMGECIVQPRKMSRREFIAAAGGTIVHIGLPGVFIKLIDSENSARAADLRPDGRPRIPPGQHAVRAIKDMGGVPGSQDLSQWRLVIGGEVEKPMTLYFKDLMRLEQINLICDVHCVTGWTLLDSRWRGIPMAAVMKLVGVKRSAGFVIFEAPGGYSSNIPIGEAAKDNVILAHSFFDHRLPVAHGAPLRALVPDRYFYKSVKWVQRIRFSVMDEPGYYEKSGYSNTADPWKEDRYQ
jgi:DMSO/TMAO reductase YedYZ molybdopterin-dependent catalytic subunit